MARGQAPSGGDFVKVSNYIAKHAEKIMTEKPALFKLRGWISRDTGVDLQEARIAEVCDAHGVKWEPVREGVAGHTRTLQGRCDALEAELLGLRARVEKLEKFWDELSGGKS